MPNADRYLGFDDRRFFEAAPSDAGREAVRDLVEDLVARYGKAAETDLRFFPGVAECLVAGGDRWSLAICSGALRPEIDDALGRMGLRDRVAVITSAEDKTRCKPDPEDYLRTLTTLRSNAGGDLGASQCLVVADSPASEASAKAAGMWAVDVAHTCAPWRLRHACAAVILPRLADLTPGWVLDVFPTLEGTGRVSTSPPQPTRLDTTRPLEARRAKAMPHE
jgi:beta-phosphoglucomutase-like phosphatase (HAD superfamily)